MEHQTTQQNGSAEHLFDASSLRYLRELRAEALQHEAVHHPYLAALREGTMRDPQEALRDFAREYQGYSAWFPRFLAAVDERLPQELRSILNENKAEELKRHSEEIKAQRIEAINEKWQEVKAMRGGPHFAMHLLVFIGNYTNETLKDQPSVIEARSCYQDLERLSVDERR